MTCAPTLTPSCCRLRESAHRLYSGWWPRTLDLAPVRTPDLAPLPSDRDRRVSVFRARIGGRRRDGFQGGAVRADPQRPRSGGLSIHALARRHGVHRRTVRQALESAVPPARKRPEGRPAPKLGEYRELVDSWLIADQTAPRTQRHTAKRIHERLVDEQGADMSERQVRRYVRERRRALGLQSMRCACRCTMSRASRRRSIGVARAR